ncbi:MAG: hypothetical protein ACLTW9_20315 [Enterocloster sp.]
MKKDSKLFKILINLDIVIASIALVILVGCTFAGVIARYVVGKPFGWIEEIQAAFIVWVYLQQEVRLTVQETIRQ